MQLAKPDPLLCVALRCTRRAEPSRGRGNHPGFGLFEKRDDLRPGNRGKTLEELVNRIAGLDVVEQSLHGYAGTREYRGAARYVRRTGDDGLGHGGNRLPPKCARFKGWGNHGRIPDAYLTGASRFSLSPGGLAFVSSSFL